MISLDILPGQAITLRDLEPGDELLGQRDVHVFEQADIDAIEAALNAKRPLLVRGEPGVGKSQLAMAAAIVLERGYCQFVIDGMTEARDLRWREDAVARLADAQLIGAYGAGDEEGKKLRADLNRENYIQPGPLWWAFDWGNAKKQATKSKTPVPLQPNTACKPVNGMVVLLDEIDKADPDVPNGLLEALGTRAFLTPENPSPIEAESWPLVVITTNEERVLPDAFLRRCVVHNIALPINQEDTMKNDQLICGLKTHLFNRGRAHFPNASEAILRAAAEITARDRRAAQEQRISPLPGQAEFLDLLRAVVSEKSPQSETEILDRLNRLSAFFLKKHPELR